MTQRAREFTTQYFSDLQQCLNTLDLSAMQKVLDRLVVARKSQHKILIMGNGGSSATASHLVNDLNKMCSTAHAVKFRAIGLTDNTPWTTALANDLAYEDIFHAQLQNFTDKDDVVIAITGSGNSPNILKGLALARERGATTIGLLGFDGGKAQALCDQALWFNDKHYGRVEDAHSIMGHVIANYLCEYDKA